MWSDEETKLDLCRTQNSSRAPGQALSARQVGVTLLSAPWKNTRVFLFRADNWMVDKGDDEAESEGLSVFGKVRGEVSRLSGLWCPPQSHGADSPCFQG